MAGARVSAPTVTGLPDAPALPAVGYACPVCETPVPDEAHLADHLAFAALTGDEAHERWLDEHAPGWGTAGTADLASRVRDQAETVPFEVDAPPPEARDHAHGVGSAPVGADDLDADVRRVLDEAAELTRRMTGGDADETDGDSDETDESDATDADAATDPSDDDAGAETE